MGQFKHANVIQLIGVVTISKCECFSLVVFSLIAQGSRSDNGPLFVTISDCV